MSINDNGIIEALKENPQNGFRMLMAKYQENVYWHIRRLIYRIATNEALRIISKRRQKVVSIESETTGVNLIQGDNYIDFDDKVAVKLQKAILLLPPKQQLAFNLRYYDELGFDEIAKIADSTPTSIKASYHVAKEKIIKYMNSTD